MSQEIPKPQETLSKRAEKKFLELKNLEGVQYAFNLIRKGLAIKYPKLSTKFPEVLPYHGEPHAEDVLHEAVLFALGENITDQRELELLSLAAAFHDSGFIREYDKNEPLGASLALEYMRQSQRYTETEIQRVSDIILSTEVEFDPNFKQMIRNRGDILQRVMADADVSNFGREDFDEKAENVFQELMEIGRIQSDTSETRDFFNKFREKMIRTHTWNTESAHRLRDEQKKKNLQTLSDRINKGQ